MLEIGKAIWIEHNQEDYDRNGDPLLHPRSWNLNTGGKCREWDSRRILSQHHEMGKFVVSDLENGTESRIRILDSSSFDLVSECKITYIVAESEHQGEEPKHCTVRN